MLSIEISSYLNLSGLEDLTGFVGINLVPTRQRGNAVCTAPAVLDGALASSE
jgi:hypothetical protein